MLNTHPLYSFTFFGHTSDMICASVPNNCSRAFIHGLSGSACQCLLEVKALALSPELTKEELKAMVAEKFPYGEDVD